MVDDTFGISFRVVGEDWDPRARPSGTISRVDLFEFGPVGGGDK